MSFLTSLRPLTTTSPLRALRTFSTTPPTHFARMTIIGRLGDNPEIVPTSTGDVVRYALATSSGKKENQQTNWWKVSSFMNEGAMRDYFMGLGKGSMLCVEGECSMRKFQTKDGTQSSALSIVQRNFEVLERKPPRGEEQMEGEEEGPGEGQIEEEAMMGRE